MSDAWATGSGLMLDIVEQLRKRPLLPFAYIEITPKPRRDLAIADAESILANGWSLPDGMIDSVKPPVKWEGHSRSFEFHLHAWQPVQRLLVAFDLSGEHRYFDAAFAMAMDWLRCVDIKPAGGKLAEAVREVLALDHHRWWYDMAIAQRLHRLCYIADAACRMASVPDGQIAIMLEQIMLHHAVLADGKLFKETNNHGFFQALNQMAALQRLPEMDPDGTLSALSEERLTRMIATQFNEEMVHKEHSPGYHYMLTVALTNAARSGALAPSFSAGLATAMDNLGWMISPAGELLCFGDTDPRTLYDPGDDDFFDQSPSLVATMRQTSQTPAGVKAFPKAGYAFARLYPPGAEPVFKNASYLAQMAGFHSRVHKHADHLNFFWHDRGRDILIDPARYAYAGRTQAGSDLSNQGFWYSDPKRIYVESTRAHNCVEIDARSYPRRNVKLFGSALRYAGEQGGMAVTDCDVTHLRSVRRRRILVMKPGHFLLVVDWLNDRTASHDYRQWFQFAPGWQVERTASGYSAAAPDDQTDGSGGDALSVFNLVADNSLSKPVRGQTEPQLQGWMSDTAASLVPCTSICVEALDRKMGRFATLFVFGRSVEIDEKATRFNFTMRKGQAVWSDGANRHKLTIETAEDASVTAQLVSTPIRPQNSVSKPPEN
jgi:Heparinase II/III-like protein/Heparinase II/III N-terminus